jgi:hypothetical protein
VRKNDKIRTDRACDGWIGEIMDDILYRMYFRKQWNEIRDKLLNSRYDLNRIILVPEKKKVDKLKSD